MAEINKLLYTKPLLKSEAPIYSDIVLLDQVKSYQSHLDKHGYGIPYSFNINVHLVCSIYMGPEHCHMTKF